MDHELPRLMITAPGSGRGKTTVTCALLKALIRRGLQPAVFKSGPDYIDPMFHSAVTGAKSRNLDLFLGSEGLARSLLWENGAGSSLAVIEGAMGFYDGVDMSTKASSYHLARCTETPVILAVRGNEQMLSLAAEIRGMQLLRPDSNIQGVIINQAYPEYYPMLKEGIERETGLPVLGYLPNLPQSTIESRHLGLVTAAEIHDLQARLEALAIQAEKTIDLDRILDLARQAPPLLDEVLPLPEPVAGKPVIAVAKDLAFCFYYADTLSLLEKLGARLVEFSPLEDSQLPEGCRGILLGGGYPEIHGAALSANTAMRQAIKQAILQGMPCIAECGGFMYLHEQIEGSDGAMHPMAGVIPAAVRRTNRLQRFGYMTLTALEDGVLGPKGCQLAAHEFHYWKSEAEGHGFMGEKPERPGRWTCGYSSSALYAGFPHLYLCGCPESAAAFVSACSCFKPLPDSAGGNR